MRAQKLLNIFKEKNRFIVGFQRKGIWQLASPRPQEVQSQHTISDSFIHPPLQTSYVSLQEVKPPVQQTSHPFDAALAQSVGKDILGFTGISLMGLPTNTQKSIARRVNLPLNDLIICYRSAVDE